MRSRRNRRRRTTRAEYLLLLIITLLVFFLPDFYLHIRQKHFSKNLKIHHVAGIRFNRITQSYQDIEAPKTTSTQKPEEEEIASDQTASSDQNSAQGQESEQVTYQNEMDGVRVVKLIEDTPSQEQVFVTNSQIAIISEEKLTAYSKQGEKKWEAQINAPEPYILKSKEFIYVINKQKGDIAKINQNNEIVAIVQNLGKITNIKAAENYVVFTSENPNDFKVLDSSLELYSYFSIPFGDVVDFQISSDSKNVIANILNIDEFNLESYILTYDIRGQIIGTADIDKQLVYSMRLDENMIVVSDVSLMSFDKNGLKSREIPNTASLIDVASHADKVYTLSINEKNQEHTDIVIYSQYLNKLGELELNSSKEGILAGDKFCIIYDYKDLELYDNRLNFISRYQINEHIDKMEWIDEYSFAIIGDGIVNIYEIR